MTSGQEERGRDDLPQDDAAESEPAPDIVFSLLADEAPASGTDEAVDDILRRIVDELKTAAPDEWQRLYAEFAITVSTEAAQAVYSVEDTEVAVAVPKSALRLVRDHREAAAGSDGSGPSAAPWWRMLVHATSDGSVDVDYDYGERPFPDNQLFPPAAYRADLETYPRERLPVWLAAYLGHADRQSRSPQQAAIAARADRHAAVWATLAENEFPSFPVMWARWATIAAGFVAAGSELGPRMLPALGWFESSRRSGSTLYALPDGRAVLSGGVWDAPTLDATYNGGSDMPKFFAGAPEWVAEPMLNPRIGAGLMSFCYWWESGRWYRGESPPASECAAAMPGVWSADTVADILARAVSSQPNKAQLLAASTLVSAAEVGVVTRETVLNAFGDSGSLDIDGALFQFRMAGLVTVVPEAMPKQLAIARVRQYILGLGLDTTGYALGDLVADRLSCGWMVSVPVPRGEIAGGRAIFYIADDGVLERSSPSVPPMQFVDGFEKRFQRRQRSEV
ncbi:hypothetical protein OH799_00455 [Nocardia sp. NBC_00881]|uniref:hypothetical protein n=1 Tax=Nocardia sp. NBC_00881 TaxID=2975995 RepID=UPI00386570B1|nr:hypothetical protein OH799_00455 [Nocardia sp. NBC_00881]